MQKQSSRGKSEGGKARPSRSIKKISGIFAGNLSGARCKIAFCNASNLFGRILMATSSRKRYEYKLSLGKRPDGSLIRKSFYSTKSKADARKKAERYSAKYELALLCDAPEAKPSIRFSVWAIQCLELYKKPYIKGNTYNGTYLTPVKRHLIPYFGDMNLDEIRPFHIQEYINKASKKFAPETVKKDYTILSFILQHAADNDLCKSNPAVKSIRLPKVESQATKRAYTQVQYDTVYAFAAQHPKGLAIMLLMETGITRSELLGLRWEDFQENPPEIHVNQGLVAYQDQSKGTWNVEISGLKNRYRRRTIPLIEPQLIKKLSEKPRIITVCSDRHGIMVPRN